MFIEQPVWILEGGWMAGKGGSKEKKGTDRFPYVLKYLEKLLGIWLIYWGMWEKIAMNTLKIKKMGKNNHYLIQAKKKL